MNVKALGMGLLLALSGAALAEDKPAPGAYCVVKVARGDDATLKPLATKDVDAERDTAVKAAKAEIADWEKKAAEFAKKKENKGLEFAEMKPEPATVTVAKDGFASEADAKTWADGEQDRLAGIYAIARVTGTDGIPLLEAIVQTKLKRHETELKAAYITQFNDYQTKSNAWYAKQHGPGETFKEVKPVKPKLEVLKKDLPGRAAAEKKLAELQKLEKPAKK